MKVEVVALACTEAFAEEADAEVPGVRMAVRVATAVDETGGIR